MEWSVTNLTKVELPKLLPYTEYTMEITACNILELNMPGCGVGEAIATSTFMTKRGRPGQPTGPKVLFTNATNVELRWDANFPVSAANIQDLFS